MDWELIKPSQDDIEWIKLREQGATKIINAFKLPPSFLVLVDTNIADPSAIVLDEQSLLPDTLKESTKWNMIRISTIKA